MSAGLNDALLEAHAKDDKRRLIKLYQQAADCSADEVASGFFLTHAYVFALECGDPHAQPLRERLILMGRESAL